MDWCGSMPVGTYNVGEVSYGIQWLLPVLDSVDEGDYLSIPDFGGGKFTEAYAMTPDGLIIAGRSDSPKGPVACIWFVDGTTGEWVVKSLGALSKKSKDSVATGIAYRPGSVVGELIVVGYSASILYPSEAFVWTGNPTLEEEEIGYFYDLEYILTKPVPAKPPGWVPSGS